MKDLLQGLRLNLNSLHSRQQAAILVGIDLAPIFIVETDRGQTECVFHPLTSQTVVYQTIHCDIV